jgi:hypothetical protein
MEPTKGNEMKKNLLLSLLPVVLLAGCFDETTSPVASPATIAGVPTVFVDCTNPTYTTYSIQSIQGTALANVGTEDASGGGVALSAADGVLYILNQKTSVVTAFKGGIEDQAHLVFQQNVGTGTDPYQVTKVGSKLYVTRFLANSLLVLNAATGDSIGRVDLSAFANADGFVSPVQTEFVDGKLWILSQATTKSYGYDTGRVILADTGTFKAFSSIALKMLNPQAMAVLNGKLYVSSHGTYDAAANSGIEVIDIATRSYGSMIVGPLSTGKLGKIVAVNNGLWTITSGTWPAANAVPVDLAKGTLGAAIAGLANVGSLASDGMQLWVGDRASGDKHSVSQVDPSTGGILSSVHTVLPPDAMVVMP